MTTIPNSTGSTLKRTLRRTLRRSVPRPVKRGLLVMWRVVELANNYLYDYGRFFRWSMIKKNYPSQTAFRADITRTYHSLEKGLALPQPRVGFGAEKAGQLLGMLETYAARYGLDETARVALNVLKAHDEFNTRNGVDRSAFRARFTKLARTEGVQVKSGGVKHVSKEQILAASQKDLQAFFDNRYSVRHFSGEEVDIALVERAVKMAQKTPSVCNRQSSKVHVFSLPEDKARVLSFQPGNQGWGHQISKVLVVTSDMQHFIMTGERNQCWVDGGLFAMSLVYALHSLGVGTCMLNWSVKRDTDANMRRAAGIPDAEAVIMMIAVGHLPEALLVAQSPRKQADEFLVVH